MFGSGKKETHHNGRVVVENGRVRLVDPETDSVRILENQSGENLFVEATHKARGTSNEKYVDEVAKKALANPNKSGVSGQDGHDGVSPNGFRIGWFWNQGKKTDVIGVDQVEGTVEVFTGKSDLRTDMITTSADGSSTPYGLAGDNRRMSGDRHAHKIGSRHTQNQAAMRRDHSLAKSPEEVRHTYEELDAAETHDADIPPRYVDTSAGFSADEWAFLANND